MTGRTTRSVQFRQPRLGRRPTEPSPEPGAARSLTRSLLFSLTIILGFTVVASATDTASSPDLGTSPNAALDESTGAAFPSRIVALLSSGQPAGDLLGVVTWTVGPTGEEGDTDWPLRVIAEVDGAGLLADHEGDSLRVDVFGYVLSAEGVLFAHFNQSHTLPVG
jgi:hypothetical protein